MGDCRLGAPALWPGDGGQKVEKREGEGDTSVRGNYGIKPQLGESIGDRDKHSRAGQGGLGLHPMENTGRCRDTNMPTGR